MSLYLCREDNIVVMGFIIHYIRLIKLCLRKERKMHTYIDTYVRTYIHTYIHSYVRTHTYMHIAMERFLCAYIGSTLVVSEDRM